MKKYIAFVILFLVLHSNVVFADFSEKLQNHWAKDIVNKQFVEKYFQYLAKDDYSDFVPDSSITIQSFNGSLNKLIETYRTTSNNSSIGLSEIEDGKESNDVLLRKDAIKMIINAINGESEDNDKEIPFNDLNKLENQYVDAITKAYNLEIIKGYSDGRLGPEESINQIEAIILLQRLKNVFINRIQDIPFKIIKSETKYSGKEGIVIDDNDDSINITITKMLSNPGYNINIKKIEQVESSKYKIYVNTVKPDSKKMYPQVISYKSIILEISKDYLGKEYKFESDFPKNSELKN